MNSTTITSQFSGTGMFLVSLKRPLSISFKGHLRQVVGLQLLQVGLARVVTHLPDVPCPTCMYTDFEHAHSKLVGSLVFHVNTIQKRAIQNTHTHKHTPIRSLKMRKPLHVRLVSYWFLFENQFKGYRASKTHLPHSHQMGGVAAVSNLMLGNPKTSFSSKWQFQWTGGKF